MSLLLRSDDGELTYEKLEGTYKQERPPANPIAQPDNLISSTEAIQIISQHGVREHYTKFGDLIQPSLNLEFADRHNESGPMIWAGHFSAFEAEGFLIIEINAHTGEFIRSYDPSSQE